MRYGISGINAEASALVLQLAELAKGNHKVGVAESCTGGLLAALMTEPAGASQWFLCGFTAYSNDAKMRMLDVKVETLDRFGAVSEETAEEMCAGVLANSEATVAASITGVAGPSGGTSEKSVGTVCFGWQIKPHTLLTETVRFDGNRQEIRSASTLKSLKVLISMLAPLQ